MSNILPKKSWHVYNEENRLKVKKDENIANVEKEIIDERSKTAEREYRLSILRNRSTDSNFLLSNSKPKDSVKNVISKEKSSHIERFELFKPENESSLKDNTDGESKKRNFLVDDREKKLRIRNVTEKCLETTHWREDPIHKYNNIEVKTKIHSKRTNHSKTSNHTNRFSILDFKCKQSESNQDANKQALLTERLSREAKERQRENELLLRVFKHD